MNRLVEVFCATQRHQKKEKKEKKKETQTKVRMAFFLQLVNQWLNFTYSRSHAFRYERKNTNPTLVRIELTTSALAGVQVT